MTFSEEKLTVLETIDRSFTDGTPESHKLTNALFVLNLLLVGVFIIDVAHLIGFFSAWEGFEVFVRSIEIIFGSVFVMEFTLRSVFVYIPNKQFFSAYSIINMVVIVSLLAPQFIGNLVILRFFQLFKVYKIYKDKKSQQVIDETAEVKSASLV